MTRDKENDPQNGEPLAIAAPLRLVVDQLSSYANWTDAQWAEHDAKVAASRDAHDQQRQRERFDRYLAFGFPRRALQVCLGGLEGLPMVERVQRWKRERGWVPDKKRNILVLAGGVGCGKTVAATWWAWARDNPPLFRRASEFAATSRYDRQDRGPDGRAVILEAKELVLDDFGAEYLDERGSSLVDLEELLDVFCADCRPLLLTTNCDKEKFRARYGERISDRIRECGSWFQASGGSLRGRASAV